MSIANTSLSDGFDWYDQLEQGRDGGDTTKTDNAVPVESLFCEGKSLWRKKFNRKSAHFY